MTLSYIPSDTNAEGILKAAASGVLPNGKPVVVNADGTVSVVAETSINQGVGSYTVFESATSSWNASAYDSNVKRIVIAYSDEGNSQHGTAVVCAVDGTSLTFGTPVVFASAEAKHFSLAFDSSNNKIVIAWHNYVSGTDTGQAIVATVDSSNNSISFGSAVTFVSAAGKWMGAAFDSTNNKVVIAYSDWGNSQRGTAVVGTVSGTSISFGSAVVFETGSAVHNIVMFDSSNDKIVIAYSDQADGDDGKAIVGTVSGTSISFGSSTDFETGGVEGNYMGAAFDTTNNKVVIAYADTNNSAYGTGIVGTVSGTSISFGTPTVFETAYSPYINVAFNAAAGKVIIAYQDKGNDNGMGTYVEGTVSNTSISFNSPATFPGTGDRDAIYISVTYDSDQYASVISFRNTDNSSHGTSFSYQSTATVTNLTSENYIGISSGGTYASGSNATVKIIGNTANVPERNYALDTASYDNKSADVNDLASVLTPRGLAFNADGSRMFTTETSDAASAQACYQFDLSTNFDVSTASYNNVSLNVSNASANRDPMGIAFNTDGTRLFVVGSQSSADGVFQYNLSTGFNLSTGSDSNLSVDTSSQDSFPKDLAFNSDGTKMFLLGSENDKVSQYTLSSAFTINTASFDSVDLDVSSQEASPTGLAFNSDGTQLFVGGFGDNVHMYNLSSAFNLSTASYSGVTFDVSSQVATPLSLEFNATGTKMYVAKSPGEVLQYSTSFSLTAGQSHFVQTDGTIGLTADDPSVFAGTAISATKLIVKT